MNFLHLRAFHAVASERSFTRAAQVLHVSQSTLSWQVKALEDLYGVRLLDRRGKQVVPTEAGQRTLELCREIFRLQDEIEQNLSQSVKLQSGRLKVGADGPRHVLPVLNEFMRLHPNIDVSLSTGSAKKVMTDLLNYEVDVAIVASESTREAQLHMVHYVTYQLVAYVPRDHKWSHRQSIRPIDFHGERIIVREPASMTRQKFLRSLTRAGAIPSAMIEIDNREATREAVAIGMGVSVMSAAEFPGADNRCVSLSIKDPSLQFTEYVACLKQRRDLRTVREFFRVAGQFAKPRFTPT
ncbi:LysR substrate-binding domain-containing protein [Leptospira interrogans]